MEKTEYKVDINQENQSSTYATKQSFSQSENFPRKLVKAASTNDTWEKVVEEFKEWKGEKANIMKMGLGYARNDYGLATDILNDAKNGSRNVATTIENLFDDIRYKNAPQYREWLFNCLEKLEKAGVQPHMLFFAVQAACISGVSFNAKTKEITIVVNNVEKKFDVQPIVSALGTFGSNRGGDPVAASFRRAVDATLVLIGLPFPKFTQKNSTFQAEAAYIGLKDDKELEGIYHGCFIAKTTKDKIAAGQKEYYLQMIQDFLRSQSRGTQIAIHKSIARQLTAQGIALDVPRGWPTDKIELAKAEISRWRIN